MKLVFLSSNKIVTFSFVAGIFELSRKTEDSLLFLSSLSEKLKSPTSLLSVDTKPKLNGISTPIHSPSVEVTKKPKRKKANRTGFPVKKKKKKVPVATHVQEETQDTVKESDKEAMEDTKEIGDLKETGKGNVDETGTEVTKENVVKGVDVHELKEDGVLLEPSENVDKASNRKSNAPVNTDANASTVNNALKETNVKLKVGEATRIESDEKSPESEGRGRRKRRSAKTKDADVLENIENTVDLSPPQKEKKSLNLDARSRKVCEEPLKAKVDTEVPSIKEAAVSNGESLTEEKTKDIVVALTECSVLIDPIKSTGDTANANRTEKSEAQPAESDISDVKPVESGLGRSKRKKAEEKKEEESSKGSDEIDEQAMGSTRPKRSVTQKREQEDTERQEEEERTSSRPKRNVKKVILNYSNTEEEVSGKSKRVKQKLDKTVEETKKTLEDLEVSVSEKTDDISETNSEKPKKCLKERSEEQSSKPEEKETVVETSKTEDPKSDKLDESTRTDSEDDSKENVMLDVRLGRDAKIDAEDSELIEKDKEKLGEIDDEVEKETGDKSSRQRKVNEEDKDVEEDKTDGVLDETKDNEDEKEEARMGRKTKSKEALDVLTPAKKSRRIELRKQKKEQEKEANEEKEEEGKNRKRRGKFSERGVGGKKSRGKHRDDSDTEKKKKEVGPAKWGKRYLSAGLLSDTYKEDADTAKVKSKAEDFPGGFLPPPAYCNKWVRQRRVDFKLPHDLWWLHTHNQLPGRNAVPSWNYKKIRTNVYYDIKPNYSSYEAQACNCELPKDPNKRGCGEDCLNRLVYTECVPNMCPCGTRCANQSIQKHEWAPGLIKFMTDGKGWGVKTRDLIKAGSFILEYVGEVVSEKEFKNRMGTIYANDTHHYCLNLDKGKTVFCWY